jgi:L-asparaginase
MAADPPAIMVLATGGTIAGAADARSHAGYDAGKVTAAQLIASVPGIDKVARLQSEQISSIGSQDMNEEVWFKLAQRINELQKAGDVDGIVITHGTDTMEETAIFLDYVVVGEKPVVLVGSMRPSTAVSADGPLNLLEATMVAGAPAARGRGVMVVLDDTIHAARDVTKTHTTSVATFKSPNLGPVGAVSPNEVRFYSTTPPLDRPRALALPDAPPLPRVDIIYSHAGMSAESSRQAVQGGAKGIVLAGVGDGNASKETIATLFEAAAKGVVVVRSSRTGGGAVMRNMELDDDKLGFATSHELNPQKSRVLLQLLLANGVQNPMAIDLAMAGGDAAAASGSSEPGAKRGQ